MKNLNFKQLAMGVLVVSFVSSASLALADENRSPINNPFTMVSTNNTTSEIPKEAFVSDQNKDRQNMVDDAEDNTSADYVKFDNGENLSN